LVGLLCLQQPALDGLAQSRVGEHPIANEL